MDRRSLLAVVGLALVVRVAYWAVVTPDYVPVSDAGHYFQIAENVAGGLGISHPFPQVEVHPTAFRPPLYPALLGSLFWVFGPSVTLGRLLSLGLGLAVVALTALLVQEISGRRRTALVAAALVAVFPPLVANDVVLLTEPLSLALLLAGALLLFRRHAVAAGLVIGLLALSRTSGQLVLPVVAGWVWWQLGWRRALGFAAAGLLVLAPWAVRNWVQLGTPTLATSNGFNLAAVYSEPARAHGGFVDAVYESEFAEYRMLQFDEAAWDAALRRDALDSLRRHPQMLLQVPARNLAAFLELQPSRNRAPELLDGRNPTVRDLAAPFVPLLAAAGSLGLWRRRRDPRVVLLAGVGAYFFLASIFTIAPPRLRAPVDLVWCVGVALLVAEAWPGGRGSGSGPLAAGLPLEVDGERRPVGQVLTGG